MSSSYSRRSTSSKDRRQSGRRSASWTSVGRSDRTISCPSNRILPPTMRPFDGSRRVIANAVVVFPQPDSPTRPIVSPLFRVNVTSSTAWTVPFRILKYTFRFSTFSNASPTSSPLPQPRVHNLVERAADEEEREADQGDREPGREEPPPRGQRLRLGDE